MLGPWIVLRTVGAQPRATHHYFRWGARVLRRRVLKHFYLDARLLALQPDVLHFEFGALAAERMYLKQLLGCRVTVSFRGYDLNYVGLDQADYYRPVWEKADGLHFLGRDLWQRAQSRGCPEQKHHTLIPPAIDTDYFAPIERLSPENEPDSMRIVSVGRLDWTKGYEYALQAIQKLVAQGVKCKYRIIGDGDYFGPLAFYRHELGLDDVVELLGAQPRHLVRAQLSWAHVLLHSGVSEGFCNSVVEAQAMQLPVVCTDAGGLSENVVDGETGLIAPRRDPDALVARLQLLAGDPGLRRRMGEAGRRRVLNCFQLSDQIAAFDRFYRDVYAN